MTKIEEIKESLKLELNPSLSNNNIFIINQGENSPNKE